MSAMCLVTASMSSTARTHLVLGNSPLLSSLPLSEPKNLHAKNRCFRNKHTLRNFLHSSISGSTVRTTRASISSSEASHSQDLQQLHPLDAARAADLKQRIAALAGTKYGTDLEAEARTDIAALIKELEVLSPSASPASVDLHGSEWHLVYSSSVAASAGKFGPFVGRVWQEFPAEMKWQYINWVSFGPLKAKLLAEYGPTPGRNDRLDVKFVNTIFMLGPFNFRKDMSNVGWWRLSYIDRDYRILYANTGNVFVLAR